MRSPSSPGQLIAFGRPHGIRSARGAGGELATGHELLDHRPVEVTPNGSKLG